MVRQKTWLEKLDNGREPHVVRLTKPFGGMPRGTNMLVSTPREVDSFIKGIPEGQFLSVEELRRKLAARHGADGTCPLSTGIFLRITSEAAWEEIQKGRDPSKVTPFWRAVPPGSPLAKKLACGENFIRKMQRQEGIPAR
jgi:hypothetical protein